MGHTTALPDLEDRDRLTAEAANRPRAALRGNLVPRDPGGLPHRGAGNLGLADLPWANLYVEGGVFVNGRALNEEAAGGGVEDSGGAPVLRAGGTAGVIINGNQGIRLRMADGAIEEVTQRSTLAIAGPNPALGSQVRPERRASLAGTTTLTTGITRPDLGGVDGQGRAEIPGTPEFPGSFGRDGEVINPPRPAVPSRRIFAGDLIGGSNMIFLNAGADITGREKQLIALAMSTGTGRELMIMEVFTATLYGDGFRASQIVVDADGNYGEAKIHSNGAQVAMLDLYYLYAVVNAGAATITATSKIEATWVEEPDDQEVLIWHRGRDNATLIREGGEFRPYNGAFIGMAIVGDAGVEGVLNAIPIGHANDALASPLAGGASIRRLSSAGTMYEVAQDHDPCMPCVMRGNWNPITRAAFDTSLQVIEEVNGDPVDQTSGRPYFVYAPIGLSNPAEAAFGSAVPPVPVQGGSGRAWIHPDANARAMCIAAYTGR